MDANSFDILREIAEENTPDGIGLCPEIVEFKQNGKIATVTVGVPPEVINWLLTGSHTAKLLIFKNEDFQRVKKALESKS